MAVASAVLAVSMAAGSCSKSYVVRTTSATILAAAAREPVMSSSRYLWGARSVNSNKPCGAVWSAGRCGQRSGVVSGVVSGVSAVPWRRFNLDGNRGLGWVGPDAHVLQVLQPVADLLEPERGDRNSRAAADAVRPARVSQAAVAVATGEPPELRRGSGTK